MIRNPKEGLRDERGAAAVEFALLLPFIFALHIAAADFLFAFEAQRKVTHIAEVMADLTSQNRTVSDQDLNDIMAAATTLAYPLPTNSLGVRISSITANDHGSPNPADWTVNQHYQGSSPSVPRGYLGANENVIVADVIYDYHAIFGMFVPSTMHFEQHAYVRPRLTPKIDKT